MRNDNGSGQGEKGSDIFTSLREPDTWNGGLLGVGGCFLFLNGFQAANQLRKLKLSQRAKGEEGGEWNEMSRDRSSFPSKRTMEEKN